VVLDHQVSVQEEMQFLIGCIVNALQTTDVRRIRTVYQFVLHIVQ